MLRDFTYATSTHKYHDYIEKNFINVLCDPYLYFLLIDLNSKFSYLISILITMSVPDGDQEPFNFNPVYLPSL